MRKNRRKWDSSGKKLKCQKTAEEYLKKTVDGIQASSIVQSVLVFGSKEKQLRRFSVSDSEAGEFEDDRVDFSGSEEGESKGARFWASSPKLVEFFPGFVSVPGVEPQVNEGNVEAMAFEDYDDGKRRLAKLSRVRVGVVAGQVESSVKKNQHTNLELGGPSYTETFPPLQAQEKGFKSQVNGQGNASNCKALFPANRNPVQCPKLDHHVDLSNADTCVLVEDDMDGDFDIWKLCLVGYVAGRFPGIKALNDMVKNNWKCAATLTMHESGWLVFRFLKEEDKCAVLNAGPYLVFGRPLMLKAMPEFFNFDVKEMTTVSVWIKFPSLPIKCWSTGCLSKIASCIGKPLYSDKLTASMARLSFARVLVEVDLLGPLQSSIDILLPNGELMEQAVQYENLPKFCKHCNAMGHTMGVCLKAPVKFHQKEVIAKKDTTTSERQNHEATPKQGGRVLVGLERVSSGVETQSSLPKDKGKVIESEDGGQQDLVGKRGIKNHVHNNSGITTRNGGKSKVGGQESNEITLTGKLVNSGVIGNKENGGMANKGDNVCTGSKGNVISLDGRKFKDVVTDGKGVLMLFNKLSLVLGKRQLSTLAFCGNLTMVWFKCSMPGLALVLVTGSP